MLHKIRSICRLIRRLRFRYARLLILSIFKLWIRKIHNPENLPKQGPVIIVSNHLSYLDWIFLSAIYVNTYIAFFAAKELKSRPIVWWLVKVHNTIFIDRTKPGLTFFKEAIWRLKNNSIFVVYPEGKRSRSGKMLRPKIGFVKLAMALNVPIVPVAMKGTYQILPPGRRIPRFKRCEVFVGDRLHLTPDSKIFRDIFESEGGKDKLSEQGQEKVALRIMEKIKSLTGQEWEDG